MGQAADACFCEVERDVDPEGGTVQDVANEDNIMAAVMAEVHKKVAALEDVLKAWGQAAIRAMDCKSEAVLYPCQVGGHGFGG